MSYFSFTGVKGGGASYRLCLLVSFNCFFDSILFDYKWKKSMKKNESEKSRQGLLICWCKKLLSNFTPLHLAFLRICLSQIQRS